ncbi:type I glyceraldehyde-3-phosphate dehydrogenase [Mucilaginibacter sp. cycad4]|uniref:type I glyceraldehyde-3-phosphate dehydrogenase n=1 Tax=Mucilaginibacter sp. cycad4 TaxID=3342096 RepID=UPI002AAC3C68|nr:type I glyceraldehyde-3-phosphate dehydrogenase [Mucilaginibacter gossypii]WPV01466.1 type I glyceraldehyde-3-phosphate dehydrogenase [Mucilaginibacter gossypii]
MKKIAVYGFGRIGRQLLRIGLDRELFVPTAVADVKDLKTLTALFSVDTNYGHWKGKAASNDKGFVLNDHEIAYVDSAGGVPNWGDLGVDLVVDCSGRGTKREGAQVHLDRGAKYVLVSAPSKSLTDCDAVLLKGINLEHFDPAKHHIVSMGSCTTNALAAPIKVIREQFGIEYGLFSTVHSYTNSQSLTDQPMKDRRDSWAAAENIIPSSSGAAKALQFIWNDLKVTGKAYRVPTRTGSIAELNLITTKPCTVDEVNDAFRKAAAAGELQGVMDVLEEEWSSARIVGDSHSALMDLPLTFKQGDLLSIASWYDNEWGFSNRLAEVTQFIASKI